jgi:Mn2+/Fe2+ NRAMP family transporter
VELIALALGTFELAFLVAAVLAHPRAGAVTAALWSHQPLGNRDYLALVAANIGAVVMPWMIFYQQGAVVDKGLRERQIRIGRLDTALGAVLTQAVMAAVLIVTGATLFAHGAHRLASIGSISTALRPYLGAFASRLTFGLGITGASLLAGIVVSLAASWAVAEAFGAQRSLNDRARNAPLFYGIYGACVIAGAATVLASHSFVHVAITVEIVNALLLPVVIGFLVALAWTTLPQPYKLRVHERLALAIIVAGVGTIGLSWAALTIL